MRLLNFLSFKKLLTQSSNTLVENLKKKGPHNCGAGWWGTLFLNQFLEKSKPLSVVHIETDKYTTDSALMIFSWVSVAILK